MIAVQSAIIAMIHTFISVIIPGIFLRYLLKRKNTNYSAVYFESALEVVALGLIFNSLEFLVIVVMSRSGIASQMTLVTVKYVADLLLLICLVIWVKASIQEEFKGFAESFAQTDNMFIILISLTVGVLASIYYPHVLDSSQLRWTKLFIEGLVNSTSSSTGAFGYSALIYFPAVIFEWIPLVSLAAGFKIFLSLLLGIAVIYLVSQLKFSNTKVVKVTYFIIILSSNLGQYGIFMLGKDSVFGVVFSLLYMASLLSGEEGRGKYIRSALFFTCSIITGVITIPYLLLITFLYIFVSLGKTRPFDLLFWLITSSSLGLAIALNAMMKVPFTQVFFVIILISALFYFIRNKMIVTTLPEKAEITLRIFTLIAISLMLIADFLLMPVKVPVIPWTDALGNPIIEFRPPLDGKTSFIKFLFGYEPDLLNFTVGLGLLGMIAHVFDQRFSDNRGLRSVALFPFLMILIVLILARSSFSPFSGFNLWDMIRDVPLWYGGIIFGLFAMIGLDIAFDRFSPKSVQKFAFITCCSLLVAASVMPHWQKIVDLKELPHFTQVGGHKDKYFSELTEYLVQDKTSSNGLYIPGNSKAASMFYSFQMYTNTRIIPLSSEKQEDITAMLGNLPVMLVADMSHISSVIDHPLSEHLRIKELRSFSGQEESLYLLTKDKSFSLEKKSPSLSISPGNGFYSEERMGEKKFRWLRKEAELNLFTLQKNIYLIEFGVITNFSDAGNELSIYFNNKLIRKIGFRGYDFSAPNKVAFQVVAGKSCNIIRLVSGRPESRFSHDPRDIAYGIILPINVSQIK